MASIILLVLGFTIFLILVLCKNMNSYLCSKLPPGSTGWPLLGESLSFVHNPAKFIRDRMMKHSPNIFQTSIAGAKVAVFCGAVGNKFIYSNEAKFKTWLPPSIIEVLNLTSIDSTTTSWRLFSEILYKFLKLEAIQHFVPIMDTMAREHLSIHWVPYDEVKAQPLSREFTFSLACHLFLNIYEKEQVRGLAEPFNTLVKGLMSTPINFPGTTYNRAIKASRVVKAKIVDIIRQRKRDLVAKEYHVEDINTLKFLGRTLVASHEAGNIISEEELAGKIIGLLFASFLTTSNTIAFLIAHLAESPDVYAKVLQEQLDIAQSKGKGELLCWKDIQKMKYSWNVICESMRLKAPGHGGFREANTDIDFAGYKVPKGWKIHWSVYSTHMDPTHFPDPEKFDPARFGLKMAPGVYVPFGAGPHMCCGKEYARIETLVFLHNAVTKFKFSKANLNERIVYTPDPESVEGLRIRLHPHQT